MKPTLDRMLAIGIKGAVWGVQALLRHMDPARGGVILNLASPTGERGFPTTAVYSMVKGALGTLTRTLAAELGPRARTRQCAGARLDSYPGSRGDHSAGGIRKARDAHSAAPART